MRILVTVLFVLAAVVASAQTSDYAGHKDPALFTRIPNYFLANNYSVVDKPFDFFEFTMKAGVVKKVEGHYTHYAYAYNENMSNYPSFLQIIRNYQAAARRVGGQVLWEDERATTLLIRKGAQETWVYVQGFNEGRNYEVDIIEKGAMQQDVTANAEALKSGLAQDGHAEVPGIFFDTARAEVKPESEAALKEVAKLLAASPSLKVWVVGHTDSVGAVESNMTLSSARAAAVMKALVSRGVAPMRLASFGAGPYAPVASNANEAGRAKNRRVELVTRP